MTCDRLVVSPVSPTNKTEILLKVEINTIIYKLNQNKLKLLDMKTEGNLGPGVGQTHRILIVNVSCNIVSSL